MKTMDVFVDMDIQADPRVKKTATTLSKEFDVIVHSLKRGLINNNKIFEFNFKVKYMKISFPDYINSIFVFNYLIHFFAFFYEAIKSNGDIFYANDLDVFVPVWIAAKIKGRKIIYDTHEYYTEVKPENISKFKLLILKILSFIEKRMMKSTIINITVCELFADTFEKKYNIKKPYVIKNVSNIVHYEQKNLLREKLNINEEDKVVIYLGSLFPGRGVENIMNSIQYINKNINIVLIGPTTNEDYKLKIIKKAKKYNNFFYYGSVDQNNVFDYLHSADLGIIYYENSFFANNSLSNKIFDYMMAGLPTLAIAMSETKRIISEVSFGECFESLNAEDLGLKINEMLIDDNILEKYRKNALDYSNRIYNWNVEDEKLIKLLKENSLC